MKFVTSIFNIKNFMLIVACIGHELCFASEASKKDSILEQSQQNQEVYNTVFSFERKRDGQIVKYTETTKEGDDSISIRTQTIFDPIKNKVISVAIQHTEDVTLHSLAILLLNIENMNIAVLKQLERSLEEPGIRITIPISQLSMQIDGLAVSGRS